MTPTQPVDDHESIVAEYKFGIDVRASLWVQHQLGRSVGLLCTVVITV
jgi:hypothetical protein